MRIKAKNIVLMIFQAVSLLLLFCPGVYTDEFWLALNEHGGEKLLKSEKAVSFITKVSEADVGRFWGILAVISIVITAIVFVVQLAKKNHNNGVAGLALVQTAFFGYYSLFCIEEKWDLGASVTCYEPAFLCYLILTLMIAVVIITLVSNHKVAQNGIIDEPINAPTVIVHTDSADELRKYKELLDCGAITQEEYETKKKQILER